MPKPNSAENWSQQLHRERDRDPWLDPESVGSSSDHQQPNRAAIIAAWLRDRGAEEGILLPLDGPDAIIDRLDELTVTIRDLRLPGPVPAIDGLT